MHAPTLFSERRVTLKECELNVVTYSVGERAVCIVSNLQPGATLSRSMAKTVEEAEDLAFMTAMEKIASRPCKALPHPEDRPAGISRIEFRDDSAPATWTLSEFCAQPLSWRTEQFMGGKLVFFDVRGRQVTSGAALTLIVRSIPR